MSADNRKSGMALTSLVLGISSIALCLTILTGLPAVILGHIARSRAKNDPENYGGEGLALGGLITGYIGIALVPVLAIVFAGMTLPALAKAKSRAQTINCVNNLKQVGVSARLYAMDHKEKYPESFMDMTNELGSPKILICPSDPKRGSLHPTTFDPNDVSYELVAPGADGDKADPNAVFARCPFHGNVCLMDGSVQQAKKSH
jgi:hypothetical protein